jgi:hypothetical protein
LLVVELVADLVPVAVLEVIDLPLLGKVLVEEDPPNRFLN